MFALKLGFVVKLGNPNWNLWVGQAGPKTRQNGGLGLAQKGSPKGAKMVPKMTTKRAPKWHQTQSFFGGRESPKPFVFHVFSLKMDPRRGTKGGAKNGPIN